MIANDKVLLNTHIVPGSLVDARAFLMNKAYVVAGPRALKCTEA